METQRSTDPRSFVHLHVHSYYSFLDSTLSPEQVVELARHSGAPSVALTDTNALSGAVVFYKSAKQAGIKPILGAEVRQPFGEKREQSSSAQLCHGDPARRAVLLARNFPGYSEISRLLTRRMLKPQFDLLGELRGLSENVFILSDSPGLLEGLQAAPNLYALLLASRQRRTQNRALYECARRLKLPLTLSCDVKLASPEDAALHNLLQAMRDLTTIHRLGEEQRIDPAQHFQSTKTLEAFFGIGKAGCDPELSAQLNQAFQNNGEIARACSCELPLGQWKFPHVEGLSDAPVQRLRELAEQGLCERYGNPPPPEACQRLDKELEVIERLRFTEYFLLVRRIVEEAHARGFFTLGRGSGANSIVSYALRLTNVCPIRYNLYFERFLNPERNSPPDIDIDFSWKERDEILRWCFDFFGHDKVARISTIQTFQLRQAIREVAKAHGIAESEVNAFTRLKEVGFRTETGGGSERGAPHTCSLAEQEPWRTILAQATRLADFPHHLSIHCGGIIIAPQNLSDFVPLTQSANGFAITQMDMFSVEDLGLIKIDLLSNRSLGVLKDALEMVEKHQGVLPGGEGARAQETAEHGADGQAAGATRRAEVFQREAGRIKCPGTRRGTSVALAGIFEMRQQGPLPHPAAEPHPDAELLPIRQSVFDFEYVTNDPATCQLIDTGQTMGCFYIESPGMRALFERLHCANFEEVVAASSIIRPGVAESGMMQQYIERHQTRRSEGACKQLEEQISRSAAPGKRNCLRAAMAHGMASSSGAARPHSPAQAQASHHERRP